ncbi:Ras GTPase activation domain-containing protein [Cavenderia fasciculata]|uniref:Ras GTPase activation domain-containing protein n=1 Tax=Cavenderia fasciculata TaxID=261658 RepID=F4QFV6_CACFS|nr:Ras GTPase activation domain-containing protein [Cavenderia fasciculata]EGG14353.1 Ras GTPase activation domain-containing protein [Cavenderia fasciculata]|eukprot:XP_004351070.1 Ras GTPase activation domain-containing protein [Cavenderia fasciculata]
MEDHLTISGGGKPLVWKKSAWSNAVSLYGELVDTCVKDTQFTRGVANLLDSAEVDSFAKTVVNIYTTAGKTLPLIKDLIYTEFDTKAGAEGEGSILRGNNIVNKIEGAYVRLVGANYLRFVLSDLVSRVVHDNNMCLEIDPRKLKSYMEDVEKNRHHHQDNDKETSSGSGSSSSNTSPKENSGGNATTNNKETPASPSIPFDAERVLKENRQNLMEISQLFIDRITDPTVVEEMPREIRAVADYTAESALKYAPESLAPLIGGFIMLRFFSPAIVTPEYSKLISSDTVPSTRAKRNLVLLAKVLQNTSNGVQFGGKEDYMTCMNQFIIENKEKMTSYFKMICKDTSSLSSSSSSSLSSSGQKWSDLEGSQPPSSPSSPVSLTASAPTTWTSVSKSSNSRSISPSSAMLTKGSGGSSTTGAGSANTPSKSGGWTITTPSTLAPTPSPSSSSSSSAAGKRATSPSPIVLPSNSSSNSSSSFSWDGYIKNLEIQDLFDFHRILDLYKDKILTKLVSTNNKAAGRILELLRELGPSPKTKVEKKKQETDHAQQQQQQLGPGGFDDLTFQLERARFLFQGPNDKHDRPVFYLIVNRVKAELFDNVNPLIAHIFKVMDSCVNVSYTLIVDMSWAHISSDLKKAIFNHLPKLAEVFSRKYKKNIDKLFIVHPSAYTRAVINFMRAFTSRKLKRKIHDVYNWKQLTSFIDTENIALPETSKDYITKSYRVVKVNSKGKRQERLIKFTSNSILNIDPNSKKIQNEKRIEEIEEITSAAGSIEIGMKFTSGSLLVGNNNNSSNVNKKMGFLSIKVPGPGSGHHQNDASSTRKYVCNGELERDHIIQDIFEAGFKMGLARLSQSKGSLSHDPSVNEFKVIKVNGAGKHQDRIFKLTIDSLFNLDQQRIKSENSYAGIEEVSVDTENNDIVWLKFKSEPNKRKIICHHGEGKQLHDVLTEVINKYQKSIDLQEEVEELDFVNLQK